MRSGALLRRASTRIGMICTELSKRQCGSGFVFEEGR
jgi:hypothetical protein